MTEQKTSPSGLINDTQFKSLYIITIFPNIFQIAKKEENLISTATNYNICSQYNITSSTKLCLEPCGIICNECYQIKHLINFM